MFRKLIYSFRAKSVAVVVYIVLSALCVVFAAGMVFLIDEGCYYGCDSYYETNICYAKSYMYAVWVRDLYKSGNVSKQTVQTYDYFSERELNFSFEITADIDPDTVLGSNYSLSSPGETYTFDFGDYTVKCAVKDPITARDSYYFSYQIFNILYPVRYGMVFIFILCVGLFIADLFFLLCASGHREGEKKVVFRFQDRIPLDLFMAAALALLGTILYFMLGIRFDGTLNLIFSTLLIQLALLVLLAFLMSFAVRVKAGGWWKSAVVYRILYFTVKSAAKILTNIPVVWKVLLCVLAAEFLDAVFAVWFYKSRDLVSFLFFFAFNIIIFVGAGIAALNLDKLKQTGQKLAAGDFEYKTDTKEMRGEFKKHGENLNRIGEGMGIAVEQRLKSERLKTELITNVSHDIKTPLTSIVSYVDLLKKENIGGQAAGYIAVLDRQSARLKKLTEDLVEASKASTGNISVNLARMNICELVNQAAGEYAERFAAAGLTPVVTVPQDDLFVTADGRLLWRILDNLFGNACKYAQTGTRIYVDIKKDGAEAVVAVKNISKDRLNIDPDELTERFVRGDISRSTDGSGLGLNIAKSLAELQKGKLKIVIDGDLFKAELIFPLAGNG